jgi:hypothetical protein
MDATLMFNYLFSAVPILLPVAFLAAAEWMFLRSVRRQDGRADFFELGILYSAVVGIYCIVPAIEYLVGGLSFSVLGEFRLFQAAPTPGQLAPIFWYYAIYLACFLFSYRRFRGNEKDQKQPIKALNQKLLWVLAGAYGCTYLFFAVLAAVWNLQTPDTYGGSYLMYKGLPAGIEEIANHMIGIAVLLQLVLMAFLVLNYQKYKRYIFLWLCIEFVRIGVFGVGSRTGLMVLLLTFIITYNRYVKRLTLRTVSWVGIGLLLLFIGLGAARALSSSADDRAFYLLGSGNEFDGLFANAYDLKDLKASGQTSDLFPGIYFSDIVRMAPAGLIPSEQTDPSRWYVESFYPVYAEQGGGFAFGAISECVVGLGLFDVIWRALLVGWAFGTIRHVFVSGNNSFWNYIFYLWATVFSFQTFRVTTFNLLPRALVMLLIWWIAKSFLGHFQDSEAKLILARRAPMGSS